MLRSRTCAMAVSAFLVTASAARAVDPWEASNDDVVTTTNALRHGVVQEGHDLEGTAASPDVDWMRIMTKPGHSYEARVTGHQWDDGCGGAPCPRFQRTTATGTVLATGVASNDDIDRGQNTLGSTIRWIATTGGEERLRATGDLWIPLDLGDRYDVAFYDTTLFVPRWNNTATQATVMVLQNTTSVAVTGFVYFHGTSGALLATAGVNVPAYGVQVLATASIPGLAGQSGAAQIAHLGGYGALTGKAVALEAATGFTFDTQITPVPR